MIFTHGANTLLLHFNIQCDAVNNMHVRALIARIACSWYAWVSQVFNSFNLQISAPLIFHNFAFVFGRSSASFVSTRYNVHWQFAINYLWSCDMLLHVRICSSIYLAIPTNYYFQTRSFLLIGLFHHFVVMLFWVMFTMLFTLLVSCSLFLSLKLRLRCHLLDKIYNGGHRVFDNFDFKHVSSWETNC